MIPVTGTSSEEVMVDRPTQARYLDLSVVVGSCLPEVLRHLCRRCGPSQWVSGTVTCPVGAVSDSLPGNGQVPNYALCPHQVSFSWWF
jgi:hypothetical protein